KSQVLVFAVISEVPYDLAVYGKVWSWESQHTLWAVFIALATLWMMKTVEDRGLMTYVLSAVAALGGCLWAVLINCKFGWGFVLITSALYLLRKRRNLSLIAGLGASLVYITAAMGFILISMCSGERRTGGSKLGKYAYYAYYPLMLVLLAVWGRML
ncbi:MAG: conjugal transfer protein TraX, partial [Oscillospiraceae bacterium]|nr:conjugal transfer protein TraX [Oscillospiraceae bacterium]